MKPKINYFAIIIFYAIALICRYISNKTNVWQGVENQYFKIIIGSIGPALGAVTVFFVFKIKPVLSLKGSYSHIYIPFLLFWGVPIVLISSISYISQHTFSMDIIFAVLLYGLLEEIGWRGFLQQQLKPLPPILSISITAFLWFIWHLNAEFTRSNLIFLGILILGTWGIGKVANKTNSLLAVAAFHSLNNFFSSLNTIKIVIILVLLSIWMIGIKYSRDLQPKPEK